MGRVSGAVLWIYDFLAEDVVLLIGAAIAIVITFAAVHGIRSAAGVILFVLVVATLAISLWRTVNASR